MSTQPTASRRSRRAAICAVLAGGLLATAAPMLAGSSAAEDDARPWPFDDVPGLTRSAEPAAQDEVHSYYEAWSRDVRTARCMTSAGHTWRPEVLYPDGAVLAVADTLGVDPAPSASESPDRQNDAEQAALGPAERDGYWRALVGESSADMDHLKASDGTVPAGRDAATFATGGCTGEAQRALGSIWQLRRDLARDLDALQQQARQTTAYRQGQARFQSCAAARGQGRPDTPADLERRGADGRPGNDAGARAAVRDCAGHWYEGRDRGLGDVAQSFKTRHGEVLERQRGKYGPDAAAALRRDRDFKAYLAEAAGRAALNQGG